MNKHITKVISELADRQDLIKRACVGIKQSLETAKEEMQFRGSKDDGVAMKKVESGIELVDQILKCLS